MATTRQRSDNDSHQSHLSQASRAGGFGSSTAAPRSQRWRRSAEASRVVRNTGSPGGCTPQPSNSHRTVIEQSSNSHRTAGSERPRESTGKPTSRSARSRPVLSEHVDIEHRQAYTCVHHHTLQSPEARVWSRFSTHARPPPSLAAGTDNGVDMYASERQQAILGRARSEGRVEVNSLAYVFDVTPETIRRDLTGLERRSTPRRSRPVRSRR